MLVVLVKFISMENQYSNPKAFVDYTTRSFLTDYILDGCKYPLIFMEQFFSEIGEDGGGLESTGSYIVVVATEKGTFNGVFDPTTNYSFESRDRRFVDLIGDRVYKIIVEKLKPRLILSESKN